MDKKCFDCKFADWGPDGCWCTREGKMVNNTIGCEYGGFETDEPKTSISNYTVNTSVKKAEWIKGFKDGSWHCSNCKAIVEKEEQDNHNWIYCYHCGCLMNNW